jgi:hypothetical protein
MSGESKYVPSPEEALAQAEKLEAEKTLDAALEELDAKISRMDDGAAFSGKVRDAIRLWFEEFQKRAAVQFPRLECEWEKDVTEAFDQERHLVGASDGQHEYDDIAVVRSNIAIRTPREVAEWRAQHPQSVAELADHLNDPEAYK